MSDQKKVTRTTLLTRGGGFALAAPLALILGYLLLMLSLVTLGLILAVIFDIGGIQELVGNFLVPLIAIFALGMGTFLWLLYATGRYIGGLRNIWRRLRGIREEQARVEELIDNAAVDRLSINDEGELIDENRDAGSARQSYQ